MSKELKEDQWILKAKEIEHAPSWLREGDTVEVVYGEFEEIEIYICIYACICTEGSCNSVTNSLQPLRAHLVILFLRKNRYNPLV